MYIICGFFLLLMWLCWSDYAGMNERLCVIVFYYICYFLYVFIQTAKYFVSVCFKKIVKWEYIQLQDEVVSGEVTG